MKILVRLLAANLLSLSLVAYQDIQSPIYVVNTAIDQMRAGKTHVACLESSIEEERDESGKLKYSKNTPPNPRKDSLEVSGVKIDLPTMFYSRYWFSFSNPADTSGYFFIKDRPYRVMFSPKGVSIKSPADEFINRLTGNIVIDRKDYFTSSITGKVEKPFKFGMRVGYWGINIIPITITIHYFEFTMTRERIRNFSTEKEVHASVKYSAPFRDHWTRTYDFTYSNCVIK